MLEIRHQVVRGAAREAPDARVLDDGLVELDEDGVDSFQPVSSVMSMTMLGLLSAALAGLDRENQSSQD